MISEINMLTGDEKEEILQRFNDTKAEYPKDRTIHELFEEQVEKTPDNKANGNSEILEVARKK